MKHLDEVGETYCQHFKAAFSVVGKLALATHCQLLHAIFPFIKPPLGCDLKTLIKELERSLPENRNVKSTEEGLYEVYGGD